MPRLTALALLCTGLATGAAAADPSAAHSWGNLRVSYLQYRTDVSECGRNVTKTAVDPKTSSIVFTEDPLNYERELYFYAERLKGEVVPALQRELDACLTRRGYARFRLTPEQQARVSALPPGSQARQEYLFSLASDPKVQAEQRL